MWKKYTLRRPKSSNRFTRILNWLVYNIPSATISVVAAPIYPPAMHIFQLALNTIYLFINTPYKTVYSHPLRQLFGFHTVPWFSRNRVIIDFFFFIIIIYSIRTTKLLMPLIFATYLRVYIIEELAVNIILQLLWYDIVLYVYTAHRCINSLNTEWRNFKI